MQLLYTMALTRRKFLKHLAFSVMACGVGPAAVAKLLPPPIAGAKWVYIDVIKPLNPWPIAGDRPLQGIEEDLSLTRIKVNPLFTGKIGLYEGVTIHRHKADRRLNRN